jgi:hypothetical protein
VRLEEGIITLPFENGNAARHAVANIKGLVVCSARNSVSSMDVSSDEFTAWKIE